MAQPLSFLITLFDKMSGPADKMSVSIDKLGGSLDKTTGFFSGAESGLTKLSSALHVARSGFHLARGAAEGIVGVLEKIGENQATQGIFEDALGKAEGSGVLDWLGKIQRSTAFTRDQLEGLTQPLLEQFKGDTLRDVLVAALDVGRGSMDRTREVLDTFMKVQAAGGKMKIGAFRSLGLTAPEGFKGAKAVGGEAEVAVTIDKLLSMVAAKSGGQLGGRALQSADTMGAAINHLKGMPGELWEQLSNSPQLPKITGAINKFTDALTSERVISSLASVLEKLANGIPEFLERLARFINEVDWARVGDQLLRLIEMLPKVETAARLAGGTVSSVSNIGRTVNIANDREKLDAEDKLLEDKAGWGWLHRKVFFTWDERDAALAKIRGDAAAGFVDVGQAAREGFNLGFNPGKVGGEAGGAVVESFAGPEGIDAHSPSRKFAQLGRFAAEGFSGGFDSEASAISTSIAVDDSALRSGVGGSGISITFGDINVDGAGKEGPALADLIGQRIRDTVRDVLDEFGVEAGLVN